MPLLLCERTKTVAVVLESSNLILGSTRIKAGTHQCALPYGVVSVSVFMFLPETLPESFAATRALANG